MLHYSLNGYKILVGKPEGKRPLEKPRRRWKGNNKIQFYEIGYVGVDWINLGQDKVQWRDLVNTVIDIRFPRYFLAR
jgi:hypothetical protein